MKKLISILVLFLTACNGHIPLKKNMVSENATVLITTINCGQPKIINIGSAGVTGAILFGLVGAAVGSAIDSAVAKGDAEDLFYGMENWNFCQNFKDNLKTQLAAKNNWTYVFDSEIITDTNKTEFEEYIRYLKSGVVMKDETKLVDRADQEKVRAKKKKLLNTIKAQLLEPARIDHVLLLQFERYGFTSSYGKGNYQVILNGILLDLKKPGRPKWKRSIKKPKLATSAKTAIKLEDQYERPPEEKKKEIWSRAIEVIDTISDDF